MSPQLRIYEFNKWKIGWFNQGALPDFPPKKFFGNLEPNFISQRKKHLENYFNTLLRTVNLDKVTILKDFLFHGKKNEENPPDKSKENAPKNPMKKPKEENKEENQKEKEQPQNSVLKATGGNIEKMVDFYQNKMLDITSNTSYPEEEEVLKRRKYYEKMVLGKIKVVGLLEKYRLPIGHERNLIGVKKESKFTENANGIKLMDAVMAGIMAKDDKVEEFVKAPILVHNFK